METKSKVITLYPVLAGNGAKFIATNLAHVLKNNNPNKKIALVDLNLKQPYLAQALTTFDEIHGIDNLIDKIEGNLLTDELFEENMVMMKDNVSVLKGTKLVGKHKVFNQKHITVAIEYLRQLYDYVLIAVAPEVDNAGTVYALNEADKVVMVVRNNVSNYQRIPESLAIVNQYRKNDEPVKMIYNMYVQNSTVDFSNLVKENHIEVLGMVDYDENAIDNTNLTNSSGVKLFRQKDKNQEAFVNISKSL